MHKTPTYNKLSKTKPSNRGFTLIELLMVFTVIAILASITFGVTRGVRNAQNRAKAQVELMAISTALEQYKARYGDYPWINVADVTDSEQINDASHGLMKTLVGWRAFDGTEVGGTDSRGEVFEKGKSVLDISTLSLSEDWPTSNPEASPSSETFLIDPWGNSYVYIYKDEGDPNKWEKFGYILYSRGPDAESEENIFSEEIDEATGLLTDGFRDVADAEGIIFSGE